MSILVPFGVAAGLLVVATLELVRRRRLKERYAVIWIGFATTMLAGVLFPGIVARVSSFLGFEVPANLVISVGILALALVSIQLTVDMTRLRDKTEAITSRLAIIELELRNRSDEDESETDGI